MFPMDKRMFAVTTGYVLTIDPDPGDTIYNRLQYLNSRLDI